MTTKRTIIVIVALAVAAFTIGGAAQTPPAGPTTAPVGTGPGRYQLCSGRYPFAHKGAATMMMEGLFRLDTQTGQLCEFSVEVDENHRVNKTWLEIMPADGVGQSQR